MQGIHRGFALRKLKVPARTGMGQDFVSPVPITRGYLLPWYFGHIYSKYIYKWNENNSLSVRQYVHTKVVWQDVVAIYKHKPVTLN